MEQEFTSHFLIRKRHQKNEMAVHSILPEVWKNVTEESKIEKSSRRMERRKKVPEGWKIINIPVG